MDQTRTGELIRMFRQRMGLTQKQLAERINVTGKTVSKWECGSGCPDISLISTLADVFGTEAGVLLSGVIDKNEREKGNMKKLRFYVCKDCGNIITAASDAAITCCGSRLSAETLQKASEKDMLTVTETDGEMVVSSDHEMTKEHYITFAAYQNESTVMIFRQYPEWELNFRMPIRRSGRFVWYCTKCGLLYQDIK